MGPYYYYFVFASFRLSAFNCKLGSLKNSMWKVQPSKKLVMKKEAPEEKPVVKKQNPSSSSASPWDLLEEASDDEEDGALLNRVMKMMPAEQCDEGGEEGYEEGEEDQEGEEGYEDGYEEGEEANEWGDEGGEEGQEEDELGYEEHEEAGYEEGEEEEAELGNEEHEEAEKDEDPMKNEWGVGGGGRDQFFDELSYFLQHGEVRPDWPHEEHEEAEEGGNEEGEEEEAELGNEEHEEAEEGGEEEGEIVDGFQLAEKVNKIWMEGLMRGEEVPKPYTPCRYFFQSGGCKARKNCPYSHDEKYRHLPLNNWKPSLCKFFLNGNCRSGEECQWSHDEAKAQQKNAAEEATRDQPKPGTQAAGNMSSRIREKKRELYPALEAEEIQEIEEDKQRLWKKSKN